MSRIAKKPIIIPTGVEVKLNDQDIVIKSNSIELTYKIHKAVEVKHIDNQLILVPRKFFDDGWTQAGTTRALLNSMVIGVTEGFIKKLQLVGIGYRVTVKDNSLFFSLGFSHPIKYVLPTGITVKCLSQTEIILKGADKQKVGQVAAELRAYRYPEPYKGKGICYADENVRIKEAKKK